MSNTKKKPSPQKILKKASEEAVKEEKKVEQKPAVPPYGLKLEYSVKLLDSNNQIADVTGTVDFPMALYGEFKLGIGDKVKSYLEQNVSDLIYVLLCEYAEDMVQHEKRNKQIIDIKSEPVNVTNDPQPDPELDELTIESEDTDESPK